MKICGYEVEFPHQPYGVQMSFMNKVLQTIEHRQNALLEAPTGSGKTLSLLCSALSWQRRLKNEGYSEAWEGRKKGDLQMPGSPDGLLAAGRVEAHPATGSSSPSTAAASDIESPECQAKKCSSLPRIYYATRTHSQIGQVVRELKRAGYQPKMAILASRSHYCVHKGVSKKPNLDEECEALLEDKGCKFYNNTQKLFGMQTLASLQVHDIEDLVKVGHSMSACPYFAARHFKEHAELIFCPYNYLLDPVIRRAVQIDVEDAVLILDEAHNIEDICRDAASCELELSTLEDVQKGLEAACFGAGGQEIYGPLADAVARTAAWLRARAERPDVRPEPGSSRRFEGVWASLELRTELDDAGLCPERVELLWELYEKARARAEEQREAPAAALADAGGLDQPAAAPAGEGQGPKVSGFPLSVLSRLLSVLRLLYAADGNDYRLAVQRTWRTAAPAQGRGRRRGRRSVEDDDEVSGWAVQMCLWSLNPAVAFRSVSEAARSVILASGTLSPLGSFASELAAEFQVRFEAPHVINARTQVWAGSIAAGPDKHSLTATFEHSKRPAFQDSLGRSITAIARVVPDGLLVFFSSYSMMDRLQERWKTTGIWSQLQQAKTLVCEPHGTGEAFDGVMKEYYDAIAEGRGAIFFAICRGKVSEGLDFTDANARAVIVVGIPFPNTKDTKVGLKKRYNDDQRKRGQPQLLSGDLWYSQQAFRALNQAIGRCIRHKHDYGGIILLDQRFGDTRNQRNLSCWVRAAINTHSDFDKAMADLTAFFARLTADPPSGKPVSGKRAHSTSAAQLSSGVGPGGRSGKPHSSGPGHSGQPRKIADTAGSKPVATSEFATHSQPTLSAVWRKPAADLRKADRPPAAKQAPDQAHAKPAVPGPGSQSAPGSCMPCSPLPSPAKPGEMPRTQTRGRGAEAVTEGAWASSMSTSASSQQQGPSSSAAADPQHAAHGPSQPTSLTGSQAHTGTPAQPGQTAGPEHSSQGFGLSRLKPLDGSYPASKHDGSMGMPCPGRSIQQGAVLGMPTPGAPELASRARQQPVGGVASLGSRAAAPGQAHAHPGRAHQNRDLQGSVQQRGMSADIGAPANAAQHIMSRPLARALAGSTQAGLACTSQGQQQPNISIASRQTQDSAMTISQLHTPAASESLASEARSNNSSTPNSTSTFPAQQQRQMGRADPGSVGNPPFRDMGRPAELAESCGHRLETSGAGCALAVPATPVRMHGQGHPPSKTSQLGITQAAMHPLPTYAPGAQMPTPRPHGQPALHGQHCQQGAGMPAQEQWLHRRSTMQQEQHLHSSGLPQPQWQPKHRPVLQHVSNLGPVQPSSSALQHGSKTPQQGNSHLLHQQPPQQAPQQHTHAQSSQQRSSSAPQQPNSGGMPGCRVVPSPQLPPHQLANQHVHAGDILRDRSSTPEIGSQRNTQFSSKVQLQQQLYNQQARPQPQGHHVSSSSAGPQTAPATQSLRIPGRLDQPQPCSTAAAGSARHQQSLHAGRSTGTKHHGRACVQQGAAPLQHRSSDAATGPQRPAVPIPGPSGRHGAQQQSSLLKQSFRSTPAQPAASGPMTGPPEPSSSIGKPIKALQGPAGRRQGSGEAETAPNPGHKLVMRSRGPFKGTLMPEVLRAWVTRDLAAHAAHLRRTSEEGGTDPEQYEVDAREAVLDAFAYVREGLDSGMQLPEMLRIWACCPVGLQVVEAAFFAGDFHMFVGGCTGHPALSSLTGLPHQALERLLVAAAALGLVGALQEMLDAYAAEVASLQGSHQACSSPRQHLIGPAARALPAAQSSGLDSRQLLPGSLASQPPSAHMDSKHQQAVHQRSDLSMPCNSRTAVAAAAPVASGGARVSGQGAAGAVAASGTRAQSSGSDRRFGSMDVVHDSSSGDSFANGGRFAGGAAMGSVVRAAVQHQARARAGNNSMSRLREETGPAGGAAGKMLMPGQKRQALSELGPQRLKHSQKEMPAWTQGTDDSDF